MEATIINKFGRIQGWNNLSMNFLGRDIEAFTEVEYDDEVDMDNEYGGGGYPIGQSQGNYKAKGAISLYSEEIVAMQASIPVGFRVQDVPPFEIILQYELNGFVVKDVLRNVKIKNIGKALKQGDGKIVHKCDLLISHIDWKAA